MKKTIVLMLTALLTLGIGLSGCSDDVKRISELIYMHNFQNENLTYSQKSRVEKLCKKYGIDFFW